MKTVLLHDQPLSGNGNGGPAPNASGAAGSPASP